MLYKFLFILAALNFLIPVQNSRRRFNIEIYNVTCQNVSTIFKRYECDFAKLSPNVFVFNKRFMFDRDLGKDMEFRFRVDITPQNRKTSIRLIDLKGKVCDTLDHIFTSQFLKDLMMETRRTGNLPNSCPVQGNVLYQIQNFRIAETIVPPYAPFMNFTCALAFYEHNELLDSLTVKGAATPKS